MLKQLFESEKEKESLSILKNPFDNKLVQSYGTFSYLSWKGEWNHTGKINFKNGMTEGKQEFKAESFGLVIKQMEEFIKSLEK